MGHFKSESDASDSFIFIGDEPDSFIPCSYTMGRGLCTEDMIAPRAPRQSSLQEPPRRRGRGRGRRRINVLEEEVQPGKITLPTEQTPPSPCDRDFPTSGSSSAQFEDPDVCAPAPAGPVVFHDLGLIQATTGMGKDKCDFVAKWLTGEKFSEEPRKNWAIKKANVMKLLDIEKITMKSSKRKTNKLLSSSYEQSCEGQVFSDVFISSEQRAESEGAAQGYMTALDQRAESDSAVHGNMTALDQRAESDGAAHGSMTALEQGTSSQDLPGSETPSKAEEEAQEPTAHEAAAQKPAAHEAAAHKPAAQKPATQEPAAQEPAALEPATQEPAAPEEEVESPDYGVTIKGLPPKLSDEELFDFLTSYGRVSYLDQGRSGESTVARFTDKDARDWCIECMHGEDFWEDQTQKRIEAYVEFEGH